MAAGAKTFSINEESISDVQLDNPNANAVTDPADAMHRRNRLEESGEGGIHTTAGGITKEMAGADKHQPISPTSNNAYHLSQKNQDKGAGTPAIAYCYPTEKMYNTLPAKHLASILYSYFELIRDKG
jgi:hypothetical protein